MVDSVADSRVDEREVRTCHVCGGDVLEPRSGDMWNCAGCARRFTEAEVDG